MNIVVYSEADGRCHVRPDTTLEKEEKDFYVPDDVDGYRISPVIFARICKSGKCIGENFALRYFDNTGLGALLYAGLDSGSDIACSSCHDHSSILPCGNNAGVEAFGDGGTFELQLDAVSVYSSTLDRDRTEKLIIRALCTSSRHISIRIGDMIAVELNEPSPLLDCKEDSIHEIRGKFDGRDVFGFKVIK